MAKNKKEPVNATATRWIRLPQAGKVCAHTGLRRGQVLRLISDPANGIKNCHLREGNAKRGTRLVDLQSLLDFLESKATGGSEE